ncbi:MAG: arsenite methyltransferase [Bacteroidia bacterium]
MNNEDSESLKKLVRDKYAAIANQSQADNAASCCGATPTSNKVYNIMMENYTALNGYQSAADLGLGCGLPTVFAKIKRGDVVVDLGSGAGNDCFVARHETGTEGKVIGIDFTPDMIAKARKNAEQLELHNVEFRLGDIDNMPLNDAIADVVVSNCVLNLVPDKSAVMKEMFRVLKPGGHFSISDVVLKGELPAALQKSAELYAGCVAGAMQQADYLTQLEAAGFMHIEIQKAKPIHIPEDILSNYLDEQQLAQYMQLDTGIFSITVYGEKPGNKPKPRVKLSEIQNMTCKPNSNCC